MRKTITKTIPEEKVKLNLLLCDICESEIPIDQLPIYYRSLNEAATSETFSRMWRILFRIDSKVQDNPLINVDDFDVHYECAVKAISNASKVSNND